MKKEIIGDCTIFMDDCRNILSGITSVDHIISDPPYEAEAHRSMRRTAWGIKTGQPQDLDFDAITDDLREFVGREAARISNGWSMFFCQAEAVGEWRDALEVGGAKYKRSMIWVKPDSSPQFNGQMPAMGYESIALAWCGEGFASWNGGGKRGVFTHRTNNADRDGEHQTEKPLSLMKELVTLFTNPNDTVLDMFCGSGTTGVACAKLGRKFIGIERDQKYFDVTCRRIEDAYKQGDMFIPAIKPQQQTMVM